MASPQGIIFGIAVHATFCVFQCYTFLDPEGGSQKATVVVVLVVVVISSLLRLS